MAILESQLVGSNDSTITIKFTAGTKEYLLTVVNHPDFTVEQLVDRWSRRAKREYMQNRVTFQRMFIDRTNKRHEYLAANPSEINTTETA